MHCSRNGNIVDRPHFLWQRSRSLIQPLEAIEAIVVVVSVTGVVGVVVCIIVVAELHMLVSVPLFVIVDCPDITVVCLLDDCVNSVVTGVVDDSVVVGVVTGVAADVPLLYRQSEYAVQNLLSNGSPFIRLS